MLPTSQIQATIKSFQQLSHLHSTFLIWINSHIPKPVVNALKDPFFLLWRQKIPKLYVYNS
jgi:hypothetical protein